MSFRSHRPSLSSTPKIGDDLTAAAGVRGRECTTTWILLLVALVVLLVFVGAAAWLAWGPCDGHGCHNEDNHHQRGVNLVLSDSQRLVFSSPDAIPVAGNQDLIFIEVQNVDDHTVIDIAITLDVGSGTGGGKRSPPLVPAPVYCPPLYTTNTLASLASRQTVTCRSVYLLTTEDIANGNTVYTQSAATGFVQETGMTTMAEPGQSQMSLNNVALPEGAMLAVAGPTGPAGPIDVVSGHCTTTPPHTSLTCSTANQFQLLFCDFTSNATQKGYIYECVNDVWLFYGQVSSESSAGGPGVSIYSATCSGGPPPTSITAPVFTCNSAFDLNMVVCSPASPDGNAGMVYECLCQPTCAWVHVATLNGELTWRWTWSNAASLSNIENIWDNVNSVTLDALGIWYCTFEGAFTSNGATATCPLTIGISIISQSNIWAANSVRQINPGPAVGSYHPIASVITTSYVEASSSPETFYVTAGIGPHATGCAAYQVAAGGNTLRCLQLSGVP